MPRQTAAQTRERTTRAPLVDRLRDTYDLAVRRGDGLLADQLSEAICALLLAREIRTIVTLLTLVEDQHQLELPHAALRDAEAWELDVSSDPQRALTVTKVVRRACW